MEGLATSVLAYALWPLLTLLIFVFVVWVQFLDDAQGGRGWLFVLRRPMARKESPLGPTGGLDRS